MSDVPTDALEAIDWLCKEPATDRRAAAYTALVLSKAYREIERLRAELEEAEHSREINRAVATAALDERDALKASCQLDADGKPLAVCHKLATVTAERDKILEAAQVIMADADRIVKEAQAVEAERDALRAVVTDWLKFAKDVQPGCAAGADWLEGLRKRSDAALAARGKDE